MHNCQTPQLQPRFSYAHRCKACSWLCSALLYILLSCCLGGGTLTALANNAANNTTNNAAKDSATVSSWAVPAFVLSSDSVLTKPVDIGSRLWCFRTGDSTQWKDVATDDSKWQRVSSLIYLPNIDPRNWTGIAWYRLHVRVDSSLHGVPLALEFSHRGASELFIDGKRIGGHGVPSGHPDQEVPMFPGNQLTFFSFTPRSDSLHRYDHVIAVRYSDTKAWERFRRFFVQRTSVGFNLSLGSAKVMMQGTDSDKAWQQLQALLVGALGALTLLHTILLLLTRKTEQSTESSLKGQQHLQYSIFTGMLAVYFAIRVATNTYSWSNVEAFLVLRTYHNYALITAFISCVALFYAILYERFPKRLIWVWSLMPFAVFWGAAWLGVQGDEVFFVFVGIIFIEILRIIVLSVVRKRPNVWILGLGGCAFIVLLVLQVLADRRILFGQFFSAPWLLLGSMLSIPLAMSVYLSRQIAQKNRDLQAKLQEVEALTSKTIEQQVHRQILEADNNRKTQELEEARKLQLSMLPQKMPSIAGLDIAMFMQTATEVGGDYYDYCTDSDGTLTLAIGDATGHGVKAGTMVAATKSLFTVIAQDMHNPSAVGVLKPTSPVLKRMNLKAMFMALMVTRLNYDNGTVRGLVANAGMPSALIFRAAHQTVEELLLKSMPLGTMTNFPYQERPFTLHTGDVLILMSDGFPERFNERGEILGYDVAQTICTNAGGKTAQEVVEYLLGESERWANGAALNDDMTFVVVRCVAV